MTRKAGVGCSEWGCGVIAVRCWCVDLGKRVWKIAAMFPCQYQTIVPEESQATWARQVSDGGRAKGEDMRRVPIVVGGRLVSGARMVGCRCAT